MLLIEDELRLAAAVARAMREEGHVVDVIANGLDGAQQALTEEYDLLVLDIMVPGIDGFEVTRRLRKAGSSLPILMLTARDSIPDRVTGLDAGADDYMVKPFSLSEFLARVRAMGRRTRAYLGEPPILSAGDLSLDLRTRQASRGGRTIELTAKEFALLELLLRHPRQVFTRAQLLDRVWNYDVAVDSNVVDIYIHYLRRKVDRDFEPKLIQTVRGVGYALKPG